MLLQKLLSLLLLAIQTYLVAGRAAPRHYEDDGGSFSGNETNHLGRRAAIQIDPDFDIMVIQGTGADTLLSYGHDPCPGLAAVGTPYMQGGIDKVVGHRSIEREFGGVHRIAQQWVAAVRASRMTNIKVVVFIRDHNADPASIPTQIQVNTDAYYYAHSIGPAAISIETRWQQNLPSPYDSLFVNQDRSIWVGHKRVG